MCHEEFVSERCLTTEYIVKCCTRSAGIQDRNNWPGTASSRVVKVQLRLSWCRLHFMKARHTSSVISAYTLVGTEVLHTSCRLLHNACVDQLGQCAVAHPATCACTCRRSCTAVRRVSAQPASVLPASRGLSTWSATSSMRSMNSPSTAPLAAMKSRSFSSRSIAWCLHRD